MDNNEAKLILSVYRPNGQDAGDPLFHAALRQAELDPTLKSWLTDQRAFDTRIAAALASVPTPPGGKAMVQTAMAATPSRPRRRLWPLALAAAFAVLLVGRFVLSERSRLTLPPEASLAELATHLSAHHASMGMMSADYSRLRAWLSERGGPLPGHLPPGLARLDVIGCETWKTTRGNVSLICFVGDDRKALHLYVFDQVPENLSGQGLPAISEPRLEQSGDWLLALWQDNERAYVLGVPRSGDATPDLSRLFRT